MPPAGEQAVRHPVVSPRRPFPSPLPNLQSPFRRFDLRYSIGLPEQFFIATSRAGLYNGMREFGCQRSPLPEAIPDWAKSSCKKRRDFPAHFSLDAMTRFLLTIFLVAVTAMVHAQEKNAVPGMPFGPVSDADLDHLQEFAETTGFDLKGEISRVYGRDKKIDEEALGRVFKFSLSLKTFDQNARAYGHIIFISLDRIGEPFGVDYYVKILERQPANVQQRIRDFLFYPYSTLPTQDRAEAQDGLHKAYPTLFREDFKFAFGDSLFVLRDYPPDFSFTIIQEAKTKDLIVSLANVSKVKQEFVDSFSTPMPEFAFRCQFGKRNSKGAVSSRSEEFTLNTRQEHAPYPPAPLSTLRPGDNRKDVILRGSLIPRVVHALTLVPTNANYDSVRFLLSVSVNTQLTRFIAAKSPFLDLADYVKEK
jgi:hypothetical protein